MSDKQTKEEVAFGDFRCPVEHKCYKELDKCSKCEEFIDFEKEYNEVDKTEAKRRAIIEEALTNFRISEDDEEMGECLDCTKGMHNCVKCEEFMNYAEEYWDITFEREV